jgi:hypothetical protein
MGAGMTGQDTLQRDFELLNLEIDGALSGPERAELAGRLLADPALRPLRESLRRTCTALDALPDEDPPAELDAASIVAALPRRRAVAAGEGARSRIMGVSWRHAAAIAGAAVVSVLGFQVAHGPGAPSVHEVLGTMAPVLPSRVELREQRGTIEVRGSATAGPTVHARLTLAQPVVVVARLGEQELRLEDFAAVQGEALASASFESLPAAAGGGVVEVQVVDVATGKVLEAAKLRPAGAAGD